ncbi:glycoside hydrolase family 31 protein [Paenibacillus melissococcoides]|nr:MULTISPECIES: glycoside hydrolase family 31 protein [Paenibacillus]MEB9892909.1 glycoside hydrolase family 31 protein [Bacillus cereus]CAH8714396.1 glycoside hydrolase family 31 protein [Paenibacillus melissococcoides]
MPYLYTLFHEAAQTGIPVMRPLLLEFRRISTYIICAISSCWAAICS